MEAERQVQERKKKVEGLFFLFILFIYLFI
jgi:hypothetical protein